MGYHMNKSFSWATKECFARYDLKNDSKIQWMLRYGQVKTWVEIHRLKTNYVISAIGQHDQKKKNNINTHLTVQHQNFCCNLYKLIFLLKYCKIMHFHITILHFLHCRTTDIWDSVTRNIYQPNRNKLLCKCINFLSLLL